MTTKRQVPQMTQKLLEESIPQPIAPMTDLHDFQYKQSVDQLRISLSPLALIFISPLLITLHVLCSMYFAIPMIQYMFCTILTAFLVNYTLILRRYQLMPYLPHQPYDVQLKRVCVIAFIAFMVSLFFGWNGSGGMLFAMCWEQTRDRKVGVFAYFFILIIVGSLLMEKNYSIWKIIEFIPGMLFGFVNSTLYTLQKSNPYTITHQFTFLCSVCLPAFFPGCKLIVPNLIQWAIMIAMGVVMLITCLLSVQLMQSARVSVSMGIMSGILMIGTTAYTGIKDYAGAGCIIVGIALLVNKEYFEQM